MSIWDGDSIVPCLEIELHRCPQDNSRLCDLVCRRPGDFLRGFVHVRAASALHIRPVAVNLKGIQSVEITSYRTEDNELVAYPPLYDRAVTQKARDVFLDIRCDMSNVLPCLEDLITGYSNNDGLPATQQSYAFHFVVPQQLCSRREVPPICLNLLPTSLITDEGKQLSGLSFPPNMNINYSLHATVEYASAVGTNVALWKAAEVSKDITILPYVEPAPPLHAADFPGDFVLEKSLNIKAWMLGGTIGEFKFTASEPQPLKYTTLTTTATTSCNVKISAQILPTHLPALKNIVVVVTPKINSRSFMDIKPICCMPSKASLSQTSTLRFEAASMELQKVRKHGLRWKYHSDYTSMQHNTADGSRDCAGLEQFPSSVNNFHNRKSSHSGPGVPSLSRDKCFVDTTLHIPVAVPTYLIPTFCGSLTSRNYSLSLRVSLEGIYTQSCTLEIPLQVVFPAGYTGLLIEEEQVCDSCDKIIKEYQREQNPPAYNSF